MDVPEEDPEMSAGQWETLGKDRGGEHWLVLILILSEKKKTAGMIGELGGCHHSPSHPTVAFPFLEKGKDQNEVIGG